MQAQEDTRKEAEMKAACDLLWPPEVDVILTEQKQIKEKEREWKRVKA